MKYLNLPIGEVITDEHGVQWKRTNVRDMTSLCEDNYYYMPVECYCDVGLGAGYTYSDEHGGCDYCEHFIRQIKGYNIDIKADYDDKSLFDCTKCKHVKFDETNYTEIIVDV